MMDALKALLILAAFIILIIAVWVTTKITTTLNRSTR